MNYIYSLYYAKILFYIFLGTFLHKFTEFSKNEILLKTFLNINLFILIGIKLLN